MSEFKLTLTPTPVAPDATAAIDPEAAIAEAQAAVEEAQAVTEETKASAASVAANAAAAAATAPEPASITATFTPEEQAEIDSFSKKIDIADTNIVFSYGAGAQQNIAAFSDSALKNVQTKDLGEVGDMISGLVSELKNFSADGEEKKGLFGFLHKTQDKLTVMKARYTDAEINVNKICEGLEQHQIQLIKDVAMLDRLYDQNLAYFKELSMYIAAGKQRLEEVRATELAALRDKATASGLPEDAQAAKDFSDKCDRFEKKIYDLELTRNISIQMAPQIRLIQSSNQLMAEKIQSSLVNTIPLWKSQMVLALGIAHTQSAMEAQRAVTNLTNDLLRANAEKLKMATVESAKEAERGIVDIETLTATNKMLIDSMDEVLTIQREGREKRRKAEQELANIENELKAKLLELN